MSWINVGIAAVSLVAGAEQSKEAGRAAKKASRAQAGSAAAGIEESGRQFDKYQELLAPYVAGGDTAFAEQLNLLGLGGPQAQQQSVSQIEQSPMFQALARQGEQGILQNAAATGGLRGGNVQGALAQFRPNLLNQQIQQQLANLSGVSQMGQSAAAGTGAAGLQTGGNIANLYGQQGAALAGGALAQGAAQSQLIGNTGQAIGMAIPALQRQFGGQTQQQQMLAQQNQGF